MAACRSDSGSPDSPEGSPLPAALASEDAGPASPTHRTATPADGHRIGDAAVGFTVAVPAGWVEFDPESTDAIEAVGVSPRLVESLSQSVRPVLDLGGMFAFDVQTTVALGGSFGVNLNGYCLANSGLQDLDSLARASQQQFEAIGARDVTVSATKLGTVEAMRMTYKGGGGQLAPVGVQFQFFGADRRECYLTFSTTDADQDLERFDAIAATVQLA